MAKVCKAIFTMDLCKEHWKNVSNYITHDLWIIDKRKSKYSWVKLSRVSCNNTSGINVHVEHAVISDALHISINVVHFPWFFMKNDWKTMSHKKETIAMGTRENEIWNQFHLELGLSKQQAHAEQWNERVPKDTREPYCFVYALKGIVTVTANVYAIHVYCGCWPSSHFCAIAFAHTHKMHVSHFRIFQKRSLNAYCEYLSFDESFKIPWFHLYD